MRIGVDVGGTKIEALALDRADAPLARRRVATPGTYEGTVAAIVDLVGAIEADTGMQGTVGVGMPGTLSAATGLVKNANSTWLLGRPFAADIEEALGREIRCANDANCLAVSEARDGAGAGAATVFGVILGTGVGGGLVVDGQLLPGASGVAGEWGHNPLPWPNADELPGPDCYCGRRGCIETWLCGPAIERTHRERTRVTLSAPQIAAAADAGDPAAGATLDRYVDRLARALASVVNVFDPHVVVVGGGVSNIDRVIADVGPRLPSYVFGGEVSVAVRRARHGDSSGVRGAAWLWP